MFAGADEDDGRVRGGDGGDGAAARRRPVRLRDDDGAKVGRFLERAALRLGLLPDARVENHDRLLRPRRALDLRHLGEEVFFLPVPAARVDDDDFKALLFKLLDALARDDGRVGLGEGAVVGDLGFGRVLLQLVECAGPEGVGADETGAEAAHGVPAC